MGKNVFFRDCCVQPFLLYFSSHSLLLRLSYLLLADCFLIALCFRQCLAMLKTVLFDLIGVMLRSLLCDSLPVTSFFVFVPFFPFASPDLCSHTTTFLLFLRLFPLAHHSNNVDHHRLLYFFPFVIIIF